MLYRVRLGYSDDDALSSIDPDSTVIFVMNHRSNMDYILVTYMASASSALSYAVGEWARIWMLQNLIKAMGAYFIRRDSGNLLYRKVLARYVHMATQAGVTQAVFPEGGLSRDGALRPPKFGLLSYMVCGFDPKGPRDVVFIPVGLNYDRVLEDRILTAKIGKKKGEKPDFRFSFFEFIKFHVRNISLAVRGKWYRYGYACVSFGTPLSLRRHLEDQALDFRTLDEEERFGAIKSLGTRLMKDVGRAIPALPVSLVAMAFEHAGDAPLSLFELKTDIFNRINWLQKRGLHVHTPRGDHDYLVQVGLRMLTLRHIVEQIDDQDSYQVREGERLLLRYYANAIRHHFDEDSETISAETDISLFTTAQESPTP